MLHYTAQENYIRVFGLVWKSTGKKPDEFQRVGNFSGWWDKLIYKIEVEWEGGAREKSQMTEELYETYEEEKDVYTFTIV